MRLDCEAILGPGTRLRNVTRTIRIDSHDTALCTPAQSKVRQSEAIRLVVHSAGEAAHETVPSAPEELREHASLLCMNPNVDRGRPWRVHVAPLCQSGETIRQLTQPDGFRFGCPVAGHFEAGMPGRVRVIAVPDADKVKR